MTPRTTATTTTRTRQRRPSTAKPQPTLGLDKRLVLNQWLLDLFGFVHDPSTQEEPFERLASLLRDPDYEGYADDNATLFLGVLLALPNRDRTLDADTLRGYDANIVRHWQRITGGRVADGATLQLKYFQYLALLFAEIYLDRYFRNSAGLCDALTRQAAAWSVGKAAGDKVGSYLQSDLRKLAFWQATGSGKTLQMHVNILQYQHYLTLHGRADELNRVILLTPNEGLSRQHLAEFERSGIAAELFRKDGASLFTSQSVEIIDINKLRDDAGVKTVAVEAFEGNNLVLVDEGHRGSGGEDWMGKRRSLVEQGFSFEYSATFGQAMKAARDPDLTEEYAKCIIFDYSYRYFYRDGYGKDYAIFNLEDDSQSETRLRYLLGGLLAFYQQARLYRHQPDAFAPYLLAQPLMVFVGGSVTKAATRRDVSDVVDIVQFLAEVVHPSQRAAMIQRIERLLQGTAALLDEAKRDIFANTFGALHASTLTAAEVYTDLLRVVFGAPTSGTLQVEHLRGTDGEVALRVGTAQPFGVINIGDPAGLIKEIERTNERATVPLVVSEPEFSGSLWGRIDERASPVNVLIGSRKFTEGWSSWRVSAMGLMNIGQSEGSQIIQLFGRGVRLKGYGFGLKRSRKVQEERGIIAPPHLDCVETLNVFGVRADYMTAFRRYLEDEGLPSKTNRVTLELPTILHTDGLPALRVVAVKEGVDFLRDGPRPTLGRIAGMRRPSTVSVDWYPKIESQRSAGARTVGDAVDKYEGTLTAQHIALLDLQAILFALVRYKQEKGWHNLTITSQGIADLLAYPDWYKLSVPPDALAFRSMAQVRTWQEIAIALLTKYCDVFYKFKKSEYEAPFLRYRDLELDPEHNPNILKAYTFTIDNAQTDLTVQLEKLRDEIRKLEQLGTEIARKKLAAAEVGGNNFKVVLFNRHLYEPLIALDSKHAEVKPTGLNMGERTFVDDLRRHYERNTSFFTDKQVYLLRNQSRGKGIGFFEAGNFYPDFILWVLHADTQYITFIDPKGLRNLRGPDDPKIDFSRVIKEVEERLDDPGVVLNSFIVAPTPHKEVEHWNDGEGPMSIARFKARNVYFQKDEPATYIGEMLAKIVFRSPTPG
jgi:hypothetical protein